MVHVGKNRIDVGNHQIPRNKKNQQAPKKVRAGSTKSFLLNPILYESG
jgi:hypothetical protein